ncbi:conserved hypothetical protein [Bacteroidetes oral taxon 274 str. F0058]|nr:conserved hypothetical protein [Bacteroidetes oral taxon 274 str. F0058]
MSDNREISLFELLIMMWRKTKKGISNLFCFIKSSLCLSVKYFWIVIPVMILFVAAGHIVSLPVNTKYSAEGVATFFTENRLALETEIKTLNSLKNTDRAIFNKQLNLTDKQTEHLREIRVLPVIDFRSDSIPDAVAVANVPSLMSDTLNTVVPYMLSIRFILKGTTDYKPYMEGLVSYLDNIESLRTTDSVAKALTNSRIDFCNKEIERLERFSEYDYFGGGKFAVKTNYRDGITIEPSRRRLYYADIRDLIKEKDFLSAYIANKKNVINFVSPYMAVSCIPRKYILALFLVLGYLSGLLVSYLVQRRKR